LRTSKTYPKIKLSFYPSNVHCNENPIYVFPEKELCGRSPNFHIHVSVSDLHIPWIGPPMFLRQNRQKSKGIYKSLTDT
jgi:hypothetical protein